MVYSERRARRVLEGTVSHLLILKQVGEQEGHRKSPGESDSH
jgi:hypothetical protein